MIVIGLTLNILITSVNVDMFTLSFLSSVFHSIFFICCYFIKMLLFTKKIYIFIY